MLDTDGTDALVDALTCHVVLLTWEGKRNVEERDAGATATPTHVLEVHGPIFDISSIGRSAVMQNVIHHSTRLQQLCIRLTRVQG
jgi:hypothetical protein